MVNILSTIKEDEQIVEPFQDHSNNQAAKRDNLHSNYSSYRIKTCNHLNFISNPVHCGY